MLKAIKTFLFVCSLYSVTGQYDKGALWTFTDNLEPDPYQICGLSNPNGLKSNLKVPQGLSAPGQYPWVVAIFSQEKLLGGGSLIAPGVVLTAASIVVNKAAPEMVVRAGEWNMASRSQQLPSEDRQVARVVSHREFMYRSGENNIALLFLVSPFELKPHIQTICLPSQGASFDQRRCLVAGWGMVALNDKNYSNIQKKIDLPMIDRAECQDQLRKTRLGAAFELPASLICAGGEKDKGECIGDGGSALFCPMEADPTRYEQAGIVNWGIGCRQETVPAVFTSVRLFRDWIFEHLANSSNSVPFAAQSDTRNYNKNY
ncbi:phenoloxidase-activating factor 2 [Drosophila santomea]|uniref:phenoloxidase-activating factor 2 n=1 Tax=Drosophila santomea TaxID=129105 RepID=UPI0019536263|nr:phenoloxidase-activating factor 2 [Drosophila santomea]